MRIVKNEISITYKLKDNSFVRVCEQVGKDIFIVDRYWANDKMENLDTWTFESKEAVQKLLEHLDK